MKKIIVNGRNVRIKAISDYGEGEIEKLTFGWNGYLDKAVIKYPQFKDAHTFNSDKFDLVIEVE